jgi:hypothetical protein
VAERDVQTLTPEPPATVAAPPVVAPALAPGPVLMRTLQQRVGNAIVARAFDEEDAEPLDGGAAAPAAAATAPTPTFDHSGGSTVRIDADGAVEFSQKITQQIGSPHTSPEFKPDIQVSFKTDGNGNEVPGTRVITAIGLEVKTSITKVRFGHGRPDAENKAMIDQMVAEIQAHEERHRAIVETAATAALAAAHKTYVGKKQEAAARKALTQDLECATNKQHEALDAKEGLLTVAEVRRPDGRITLTLTKSASGAKYPCT